MKPWLLEVERGPTFFRMFDGERERNPAFRALADFAIFPLGAEIRNHADAATRAAAIETQRRGRFIPLFDGKF